VTSSFLNYYIQQEEKIFVKNNYIIISSKNDYYDFLVKNKNIIDISKTLLFNPDNYFDVESLGLTWGAFIVGGGTLDDSIMVFSDNTLKKNEAILEYNMEQDAPYNNLVGKKISLSYNETNVDLNIMGTSDKAQADIKISDELFIKMANFSDFFTYKITIKNLKSANNLMEKIKTLDDDSSSIVSLYNRNNGLASEFDESVIQKTISSISYACYICFTIISIILLVVLLNMIFDENKNIKITRLLGYNKYQIKFNLSLKIVFFDIIIFINTILLTYIIMFIIDGFFLIKLYNFIINIVLNLYLTVIIISILLPFTLKIPNEKI